MHDLNYHHLMYFWIVSREGSIQRASEVLHVTPASVSIQVRQLEHSLGSKLLKKRGRGLELTEMGTSVAEYAELIFSTGQELLETVKGQPADKPLLLRAGIRDVMPKLVAFELLKPGLAIDQPVRLVCHEGEMDSLVAELAIHRLDVVLTDTALDPIYKLNARSIRLGASDVHIVGTSQMVRKYRKDFPASMNGAPLLLPVKTSVVRRKLDRWFEELELKPLIRGEFADSAMLKIAAQSGMGMCNIPAIIADEVRDLYGLQFVGKVTGIQEHFYGVTVDRRVSHPAVVAMLTHT